MTSSPSWTHCFCAAFELQAIPSFCFLHGLCTCTLHRTRLLSALLNITQYFLHRLCLCDWHWALYEIRYHKESQVECHRSVATHHGIVDDHPFQLHDRKWFTLGTLCHLAMNSRMNSRRRWSCYQRCFRQVLTQYVLFCVIVSLALVPSLVILVMFLLQVYQERLLGFARFCKVMAVMAFKFWQMACCTMSGLHHKMSRRRLWKSEAEHAEKWSIRCSSGDRQSKSGRQALSNNFHIGTFSKRHSNYHIDHQYIIIIFIINISLSYLLYHQYIYIYHYHQYIINISSIYHQFW